MSSTCRRAGWPSPGRPPAARRAGCGAVVEATGEELGEFFGTVLPHLGEVR